MSELDKTLGVRPLAEVTEKKNEIAEMKKDATTEEDLEFVKENIHDLINNGKTAMDELLMFAKQTESPRAFEVVSTLIKTLLDANKDFVDLAIKKDQLNKGEKGSNNPTTVNNNLVISTDELLEKLLEKKKD